MTERVYIKNKYLITFNEIINLYTYKNDKK